PSGRVLPILTRRVDALSARSRLMKYFSHFRFDPGERKLWAGSDLVPLTRKAADLLACLISYAGATVSHQKLMQWVWPETHVQQDNIKVLVHEVRQALATVRPRRDSWDPN